jgi:SAM-dependent methyltransferase
MTTWTLRDVADHWDNTFHYDEINAATDSYFRRFTDSSPLFTLQPGWRVLDVDCRTAKGTTYFHQRCPGLRFTCLAMSPLFARLAGEETGRNTVSAEVGIFDALPLPFQDHSFDAVLSYETLEHVPWPSRFISELSRVTKPDGLLVMTTPNVLWEPVHWLAPKLGLHHGEGPHRMVPRREILLSLQSAGFQVKVERTFVLVPAGPSFLLALGRSIERLLPEFVKRTLLLRRTFICEKVAAPVDCQGCAES